MASPAGLAAATAAPSNQHPRSADDDEKVGSPATRPDPPPPSKASGRAVEPGDVGGAGPAQARSGKRRRVAVRERPPASAVYRRSASKDPAWERKLNQIRDAVEKMRSEPARPPPPPEDLSLPRRVWREFPRQHDAMAFSRECRAAVHAFSVELSADGRRRFIAATHDAFWERYAATPPEHRHHYEVIPESAPCKLYFDVEYSRCERPSLAPHEDSMVETLVGVVRDAVLAEHAVSPDPNAVVDLESSTEAKFSRHLVFTDVVFANNREMGAFVAGHVVKAIASSDDPAVRRLLLDQPPGDADACHGAPAGLADGGGPTAALPPSTAGVAHALKTVIDEGVYTRNRNFRLYLSSKVSKAVPLRRAARCSHPARDDRALFFASLVTNVPYSAEMRPLRCRTEDGGAGRVGLGGCPDASVASSLPSSSQPGRRTSDGGGWTGGGRGTSPFPEIEAFIAAFASRRGGGKARVRRWAHYEVGKTLTIDLVGNRFCERIGREHKSNGVFWVVSVERGSFYQRCYDPDCRAAGYRSDVRYVPDELLPPEQPPPTDAGGGDDSDGSWEGWLAGGGEEALQAAVVAADAGSGGQQDGAAAATAACGPKSIGTAGEADGGAACNDDELDALLASHPDVLRVITHGMSAVPML